MIKRLSSAIATILAVLCPVTAFTQTQPNAVVALHDQPASAQAIDVCGQDNPNENSIPCSQYATDNRPTMSDRNVYLVVARADPTPGIAQVSCGISFTNNITMNGFSLCADLDFPNGGWPGNGGGNRITWAAGTNCQQTVIGSEGVHAVAGAFQVFAFGDGTIEVTPNVAIPEFNVSDCSASSSDVGIAGGKVGYGNETGFNPCADQVPVESTSWGAIKKYFMD